MTATHARDGGSLELALTSRLTVRLRAVLSSALIACAPFVAHAQGFTAQQLQSMFAAGPTSGPASATALASVQATANGAVQRAGGDASATTVLATGSTTALSAATSAAYTVDVMRFGAKGDDATDDSAAINAAATYLRTRTVGPSTAGVTTIGPYAVLYFPAGHVFRINSSVNLTRIVSRVFRVEMTGAAIDCHATGKVCLDFLGSKEFETNGLNVVGNQTDTPRVGVQIGRYDAGTSADDQTHENTVITGYFTESGLHNNAAETTTFIHPKVYNLLGTLGSYAVIEDGDNHIPVAGEFVTVTDAADTISSMNENLFIGADFRTAGDSIPLFAGNTSRMRFVTSYFAGGASGCTLCVGAIIYSASAGTGSPGTLAANFDVHMETGGLKAEYLIQGDANQNLLNFTFNDHQVQATRSFFATAANVTSINARGWDLALGSLPASGGVQATLVDTPAAWTVSGIYHATSASGFNLTNWQGLKLYGSGNVDLTAGTVSAAGASIGTLYAPGGYSTPSIVIAANGTMSIAHSITYTGGNFNMAAGNLNMQAGYMQQNAAGGLTAAGTTQATAFPTAAQVDTFATVASGTGAALPAAAPAGADVTVCDAASNPLALYPDAAAGNIVSGGAALAAGAADTVKPNTCGRYVRDAGTATRWFRLF